VKKKTNDTLGYPVSDFTTHSDRYMTADETLAYIAEDENDPTSLDEFYKSVKDEYREAIEKAGYNPYYKRYPPDQYGKGRNKGVSKND
jgi:hypothetical protein